MVRVLLLICLLASGVAEAKRIKIFPAEPMLGQAVTLSMPADIFFIEQRFNWAALEKCFAVFKAEYGSERARFTLYPYRVGVCDIKREKWETWEVPSHFKIRPNPNVQVRWQPPKETVFVREAIHWRAQVHLPGDSGYKAWLEAPEKAQIPYRFSENLQGVLHAVGFSEQPGHLRLYSPMVSVKNPSGQIWRFPAPAQPVSIRPLPAYLPANITVGRLQAQAQKLPYVVDHASLNLLTLGITGHNLSPEWLPDLRDSRPVSQDFRWLIADKQTTVQWDRAGMRVTRQWQQPLQWQAYGPVTLPAMRVQYFDPQDEKLHDLWLPAQTVWVLPRPLLWGLYAVAGLAGASLLAALAWLLWQWGWRIWLWRQRQQPPRQLWRAMLTYQRWIRPWRKAPLPKTPLAWLALQPASQQKRWRQIIEHLNEALFRSNHPFG